MPQSDDIALERLLQEVLKSNKYRHVCPDFVLTIATQEAARRRGFKETVKAVKNKLHQVSGVYLTERNNDAKWLPTIQNALQTQDQQQIQQACRTIMQHHASTRERIPILAEIYSTLFEQLPPITSIIDIACGLHPLAIPWMNLASEVHYYAYDIQQDVIHFLNQYFALLPVHGSAHLCDIIQNCPDQPVDMAFVMKTLPCLEQVEKQAGRRLLHALNARYLVVSFPAYSLGGHGKGMTNFYEKHFYELVTDTNWHIRKFSFANELVFLVEKSV